MRVLVCGGRNYGKTKEERDQFAAGMADAIGDKDVKAVIQGGASGADSLAVKWALARGLPVVSVFAKWHIHGKAAGPIRNQQMLDEQAPDLVIAFPGGAGTADMVRRAKSAGVEVVDDRPME